MHKHHIDDLVDTIADCKSASYANIETGVTFLSANKSGVDQNELDRVCARASRVLGPAEREDGLRSDFAMVLTPDTVELFLRNSDEPQEVITCACGADTVSQYALEAMQNALEKIHEH